MKSQKSKNSLEQKANKVLAVLFIIFILIVILAHVITAYSIVTGAIDTESLVPGGKSYGISNRSTEKSIY
jgi:hypothetical protein